VRQHDCDGLFVFIGADAETDWLRRTLLVTIEDMS
jgi:hypothetical protein